MRGSLVDASQIFAKPHRKRERWMERMNHVLAEAATAIEQAGGGPVDRDAFARNVAEATDTYVRERHLRPGSTKEAAKLKKLVAFAFPDAPEVVALGAALDARLRGATRSRICDCLNSGARSIVNGLYKKAHTEFGNATSLMEAMDTFTEEDQAYRDAKALERCAKHLGAIDMTRGIAALEELLASLAGRPAGHESRQQIAAVKAALDFARIKAEWVEKCSVLPEDKPRRRRRRPTVDVGTQTADDEGAGEAESTMRGAPELEKETTMRGKPWPREEETTMRGRPWLEEEPTMSGRLGPGEEPVMSGALMP